MARQEDHIFFRGKELGSVEFTEQDFDEQVYKDLEHGHFKKLSVFEKHAKANKTLFDLIQQSKAQEYLLPKVVNFISRLRESIPTYTISSFEFWLIHYSGESSETQMRVRGIIVGKYVPRNAYQNMFPLGGEGRHFGSHFSFAHYSPDLDTTVASFNCFLAAFACQVGTALHHWVIPSGPPQDCIEIDMLFRKALGQDIFRTISRSERHASITSLDLLTHTNLEKKGLNELYFDVEHSRSKKAVVLVGEDGRYLGDWRDIDVDPVRSLISRIWRMLNEHQSKFHIGIISVFARKELKREDLAAFADEMLERKLADCSCAAEFSDEHRKMMDRFLKEVLLVESGYSCSYNEFVTALADKFGLKGLKEQLTTLKDKTFFDGNDRVLEDRGQVVQELENVITGQKNEYKKLLKYFDTLEVARKVKQEVFQLEPNFLSHTADIDHIREKMKGYNYLTVNYRQGEELFVLGVIYAVDIDRIAVASVSWNDFSNSNETDSSSDLAVISVIDHHKSEITTNAPSLVITRDAQSSNSTFANLLFEINDQYSTGGMSAEEIDRQIEEVSKELNYPSSVRIMRRLLARKHAILQNRQNEYYVAYEREVHEYLLCLFAMLDDTDLLTKVTEYDVDAMCSLVNRLKSLMLRKEVEVVNFDDLKRDEPDFVNKAAKKLLRTKDLHSLYDIVYKGKEEAIDELIYDTSRGVNTSFFNDTKTLNSYARITQVKHFVNNERMLAKKKGDLRSIWIERAKSDLKENPDLQLFIFMLSTISSAKELFEDQIANPRYKDEVWFWLSPESERSRASFRKFLQNFTHSPSLEHEELEFHFYGDSKELEDLCKEVVGRPFESEHHRGDSHYIVLKVPQKKIVSRKAQIAPCL